MYLFDILESNSGNNGPALKGRELMFRFSSHLQTRPLEPLC